MELSGQFRILQNAKLNALYVTYNCLSSEIYKVMVGWVKILASKYGGY
jgi:hypothetical protein